MDYEAYDFDGDFICTISDAEPMHIIHNFNLCKDGDTAVDFDLLSCLPEDCDGCAICTNKKVVIRVEGIFNVKNVEAWWNFPIKVSDEINILRNEKYDTTDFSIVVEEKEIRVHESVLTEHSTVFARMFDSDNWKETTENKISIPDFTHKIVKHIIRCCYGKSSNWFEEKEKYLVAFQFADKYDMQKFIESLKKVIVFTPYNAVEYANYFLQNNAIELVNCCIDYILSCSQYSIPIKNIQLLDAQIRSMSFDRMLVSPVLKKDLKLENRSAAYENARDVVEYY